MQGTCCAGCICYAPLATRVRAADLDTRRWLNVYNPTGIKGPDKKSHIVIVGLFFIQKKTAQPGKAKPFPQLGCHGIFFSKTYRSQRKHRYLVLPWSKRADRARTRPVSETRARVSWPFIRHPRLRDHTRTLRHHLVQCARRRNCIITTPVSQVYLQKKLLQ